MGKIHPQENWATEYLKLVPTLFDFTKFISNSCCNRYVQDGPITLIVIRLPHKSSWLAPKKVAPSLFFKGTPSGSNQESSNDRRTAMHETCKS